MESLGRLSNEEPTSLLNENSKRVDQRGIDIFVTGDVAVACMTGRIDIDSSPAVRDRLLAFLHAPHPRAVSIDLSAVTHIDSSGVATLIEALRIARGQKTELRLQGLDDRLYRLFDATGILSLFHEGVPVISNLDARRANG